MVSSLNGFLVQDGFAVHCQWPASHVSSLDGSYSMIDDIDGHIFGRLVPHIEYGGLFTGFSGRTTEWIC
jgi:hypothetical protein